jgi:hypothetical protein
MDRVDYIDTKGKWIKIGDQTYNMNEPWYLKITDEDIETLKRGMNYESRIIVSNVPVN